MRSRAPVALLACLAGCIVAPAVASAADTLEPYKATVTAAQAASLKSQGFDIQEGGADGSAVQELEIVASDKQAAQLEADGIDLEALAIDKTVAKSAALGDSPNPFFNVYRSYMEPGGVADEMKATAAANPDVMKLEQIGTSTLGKPIYAIKMTAGRAQRARRHAPRDPLLGRQPRARVDRRRDGPPPSRLVRRRTRTTRRSAS